MMSLFRWARFVSGVAIFGQIAPVAAVAAPSAGQERFYIGTYTGTSLGIYQSSLNLGTGALGSVGLVAQTSNPSFVAFDPTRRFLFAVSENSPGAVVAYSVNPTNGNLTLLNQQPSGGNGPCYVVVDDTGKNLFTANYNSGSVSVFPIQTNGQLGSATAFIQDSGSSLDPVNQTGPHCHCVTLDASNHFAFVCDLGIDKILSFVFDPVHGTLTTNTTPFTSVTAGAGPRHFTFDPAGQHGYVLNQLNSTVTAFNYNAQQGTLSSFQTLSTLPANYTGPANSAAEIAVHPSGKFLYVSNRGYNSIAVYAINLPSGSLTLTQEQATVTTPRNFAIDPTGAYCLAAGEDSANVVVYTINPQTGQLTANGQSLSLTSPVCVLPFLTQPPQPVLSVGATNSSTFQVNIGNGLNLLTYQLYQTPALGMNWNLLATGAKGQTNFMVTNSLPQGFLRVGVSTNF